VNTHSFKEVFLTLPQKKTYIKQFVSKGISFENALDLVYCTDNEKDKIQADKKLIEEINKTSVDLTMNRLRQYDMIVDTEGNPNDHLKRLNLLHPETFEAPKEAEVKDLNITINKVPVKKKK
jgi:hypothetical protein